jgi:hypothetical protein
VHLGFNSYTFTGNTLGELAYFGRLKFNPRPTTGVPLSARYELINVTLLYNPDGQTVLSTKGDELLFNPSTLSVGEFRGFSGRGDEITYLGPCVEPCNFDVFGADIKTGKVRRIASDLAFLPGDSTPYGPVPFLQNIYRTKK